MQSSPRLGLGGARGKKLPSEDVVGVTPLQGGVGEKVSRSGSPMRHSATAVATIDLGVLDRRHVEIR